jgi:Fungal Zn(2)-Cys(6) binuclear cluster domain
MTPRSVQRPEFHLDGALDHARFSRGPGFGDMNFGSYETIDDGAEDENTDALTDSKPRRRVRTGCFTCRARHIKCDELEPVCTQCIKAKKDCQRGIRAKFEERHTWFHELEENAGFAGFKEIIDESLAIADEYAGGLERYGFSESSAQKSENRSPVHGLSISGIGFSSNASHRSHTLSRSLDLTSGGQSPLDHQHLPSIQGVLRDSNQLQPDHRYRNILNGADMVQSYIGSHGRQPLDLEQSNLIQAFVDGFGSWMDTTNTINYVCHVSSVFLSNNIVFTYSPVPIPAAPKHVDPSERTVRMRSQVHTAKHREKEYSTR